MQPDTGTATPPATRANYIFFNERGLRAGWRLLIFAAILAVIALSFQLAAKRLGADAAAPAGRASVSQLALPLSQAAIELVFLLLVLAVSWLMARLERRRVGNYGLPLERRAFSSFVTGCMLWGFLPLSAVLLTMRVLGVFYFGNIGLRATEALAWGGAWGLAFLAVGLFEEFLFRGYALYTLADGIGFWPGAIIMALVFGRAHMGNGGETYIGIIGTILFALFAAATLRRTGSLWLAVGAHAGWDWGQTFFYGVNDSGLQAPGHLFNPPPIQPGRAWLSGGSVGPEGSIVTLIFWALMTAAFLIFYKPRRPPALIVTVAGNEPASSAS